MTERPIIFSAPMVRALLDGRKTQTRRVFKPRGFRFYTHPISGDRYETFDKDGVTGGGQMHSFGWGEHLYAYLPYAPGDRLYVRENFYQFGGPIAYAADGPPEFPRKMTPCIHMPRWASRLTLTVTDVRVQRLQDISEVDAIAEGVHPCRIPEAMRPIRSPLTCRPAAP